MQKGDFLYYLYSVIKKNKVMYTVTINVKTIDGRKELFRLTFKKKRTCELVVESAREIAEVVIDYSITKIK